MIHRAIVVVLAALAGCVFAATPPFSNPARIQFDSHCLQIDGKDTLVFSGAFHYFRCPRPLWPARFEKIRAAGFNAVETYVPWNWHERQQPASVDDRSRLQLGDLDAWLRMAEDYGLNVIIRPGPYICAEWSGGGFPQWLVANEKPADWPAGTQWLQTDDPRYLAWAKHWYDAVGRIVAPHQVTHRPAGTPGVILFQIENEYERLKWLPSGVKKRQLEALATFARGAGIDVPIVTCWTRQSRGVTTGPLAGVVDCVNRYPRWDVERQMTSNTAKQRLDQPDAPTMSMELQAGWYTEVGGVLSELQDGIAPVQTQNLTLFCVQVGYTFINEYMLVGGTNFDDWASRETATTYDFFAPIREDGSVGEKYQRMAAIGRMLAEHGARLARSEPVPVDVAASDPAVEVACRRAVDGSRYLFVRTEDRTGPHVGVATVTQRDGAQVTFRFALEPFGSLVLCLPPGATDSAQGEWLPRTAPAVERPAPAELPRAVLITSAQRRADPLPTRWVRLAPGDSLERHGIIDRHFLYYRVQPPPGARFSVARIGEHVIKTTHADGVLAQVGGMMLEPVSSDAESVTFEMPAEPGPAVLLFENRGLQHHTDAALEAHWRIGLTGASSDRGPLPLEFGHGEREQERGAAYSRGGDGTDWTTSPIGRDAPEPTSLLTWYRMEFELPPDRADVWVPWKLRLEAQGNGFIYVNGHCIGRTWDEGPQREFFLPECWLNRGPGRRNFVAVCLRPVTGRARITAASVQPDAAGAERRRP